ncbi:MAG: hypothetical protein CMH27_02920 [Micavibrio sp.]|nr:hypothetical protein [Micavibrio sp.]
MIENHNIFYLFLINLNSANIISDKTNDCKRAPKLILLLGLPEILGYNSYYEARAAYEGSPPPPVK